MRGPALMLTAIALFAVLDTIAKWLSAGYGSAQVIGLRSAVGLALSLPFAVRAEPIAGDRLPLHLLRGLMILASAFFFFQAFALLPLLDAYIVFFLAPFFTMGLAVAVLGERVGLRAWAWAGLAFLGVLVPILPALSGGGPLLGYLSALVGTAATAGVMITTRKLGAREGLAVAMAVPALLGVVLFGPFAVAFWVGPSPRDLVLLVLNGVVWTGANLALTAAVRAAEPSRLAPLDFTAMLWAVLFDAGVFGLAPGVLDLVGAAVVVVATLGHQADQRRERG
ncbi:MAG: DMT family transporter [Acetobacteraceae bacterium]|nr:DMT family transporter [Acetobacteraceae bacterium]